MPPVPHTLLLIRHGEIGLKSHAVRARFENVLSQRLEQALVRRGVEAIVTRSPARHFVETDDLEGAADAVRHVFGITTFSPAARAPTDLESLKEQVADYARTWWPDGATRFAIRPRRTGSHPYTSQDLGVELGSAVYVAMQEKGVPVQVDLTAPEFALQVEVRGKEAYLYHERLAGPGGLPLGTQGKMVVYLDNGDAAAAAYLMMRRGAQVYPYYMPQVVGGTRVDEEPDDHPAKRLHEALLDWNAPKELRAWRFDPDRLAGATGDPIPEDGVLLQRLALSAGVGYAKHVKAQAIVTGETARVPWAHRLPETQLESDVPVLRPLMGMTRPLVDDFREVLALPRRAGPRAQEGERAYTAGGRLDTRRTEPKAAQDPTEVQGWDPY